MEDQKNTNQQSGADQDQGTNPEPRYGKREEAAPNESAAPRLDASGRGGEKGGSGAGDIGHGTGGGMMIEGSISLQDQEAEEKFGKGSKQNTADAQPPAQGTE